jgi:hypothetical protein
LILAFTVCFCSHRCIVCYRLDTPVAEKKEVVWSTIVVLLRLLLWNHECSLHTQSLYTIRLYLLWKLENKCQNSFGRETDWWFGILHRPCLSRSSSLWPLCDAFFFPLPSIIDVLILYWFLILLFRGFPNISMEFIFRILSC